MARPGSVVSTVSPVAMLRSVYTGRYGACAGSARPMLSGAFTEWLPALGVSWHVVQVPVNEAGGATLFGNVWLLSPPTPEITIGFVLNTCSPRAIARRAPVGTSWPSSD